MKKLILLYFIPLIISLYYIYLFAINPSVNIFLFGIKQEASVTNPYFNYIPNYGHKIEYENQFLKSNDTSETIFLLGSSELTNNTEGIPYNFITSHFTTKVKAVGHAGNQCFSIYSQLLANIERLKEAPIVIVLSPGWFHSDPAYGTSTEVFLEYHSERFLNSIIRNDSSDEFTAYETNYILNHYKEFSNPGLEFYILKLFNIESKGFLHKIYYYPIIAIEKFLLQIKLKSEDTNYKIFDGKKPNIRKRIICDSLNINWDSLGIVSKKIILDNVTNNDWGIKNSYYTQYVKGETRKVIPVDTVHNQEYRDFKMLLKLLKVHNANASFVIMPLNLYCYTNLKELTPTINSLQSELNKYNYKCLNLWVDDSAKYEKGVLVDVMHLSDYAWYKVDKFIVDTYHLNK